MYRLFQTYGIKIICFLSIFEQNLRITSRLRFNLELLICSTYLLLLFLCKLYHFHVDIESIYTRHLTIILINENKQILWQARCIGNGNTLLVLELYKTYKYQK